MARKRKGAGSNNRTSEPAKSKFDIEERFDDSADEFYAGQDKILLEDGPAAKRRRRMVEQEKDLQPSDEEVHRYDETDSDEDFDDALSNNSNKEDVEGEMHEDGDGDEAVWGTSKADYYNADVIETEADAVDEENEARRLQQKQLKGMTDADFGFDDSEWALSEQQRVSSRPVIEKLPEPTIPAGASKEILVDILHTRYPEFSLLARDFVELQKLWKTLQTLASNSKHSRKGVTAETKLNTLNAYLGAIAMYFALVASSTDRTGKADKITAIDPIQLREHTVIVNLTESRRLWDSVKSIDDLQDDTDAESESATLKAAADMKKKPKTEKVVQKKERILREPSSDLEDIEMPTLPQLKGKKDKKLVNIESLLAQSTTQNADDESDFGDEEPLTEQQAAEKAKRKKSLRFYTSQIVQKSNKRGAASREAGGDDDVPRKERLRDKQERLLKEAEKRGQQKANAEEELGGDSEEDVPEEQDDDYYNSLVQNAKAKKSEKQAKAEAYAEAARQGARVYEEEQIDPNGKRKITYAIEKNKGLAPKRNKDVRNPRVKKRKKYDEKMKKLGSIRQVYKGGEGRGGYAGELTGIKTNVVKSVKL